MHNVNVLYVYILMPYTKRPPWSKSMWSNNDDKLFMDTSLCDVLASNFVFQTVRLKFTDIEMSQVPGATTIGSALDICAMTQVKKQIIYTDSYCIHLTSHGVSGVLGVLKCLQVFGKCD